MLNPLSVFQNKSTPAFLLTESILLLKKLFLSWNIYYIMLLLYIIYLTSVDTSLHTLSVRR